MTGKSIIIMGVCACGKSTLGPQLATKIGAKFIDGDDLHTKSNIMKMSRGEPLNDEDRKLWLERIGDVAFSLESKNETGVIVCSALKKSYRDKIREGNSNVIFLFLDGTYDLILERMRKRKGHFMKDHMVKSQFDTLEYPDKEYQIIKIDINTTADDVLTRALNGLHSLDKDLFKINHNEEKL